jgi:two-component sensor histidine kinase
MNTIYGLLTLQADLHRGAPSQSILLDSACRVQSMMVLYDKLYRSEETGLIPAREFIPALVQEIAGIFPQKASVQIVTSIEDFSLPVMILSPLGIIINECITNSMKYAFSGRKDGIISVSAEKTAAGIIVTLKDNGNGLPESISLEHSGGFGMQLISGLVQQLHGKIRIERNGGTAFIIETGTQNE